MLAFSITQVAAVPLSVCRHADAAAHEAARASANDVISASAYAEDAAALVSKEQGHAADGSLNLVSIMVSDDVLISEVPIDAEALPRSVNAAVLTGRTISPLLDPPLT